MFIMGFSCFSRLCPGQAGGGGDGGAAGRGLMAGGDRPCGGRAELRPEPGWEAFRRDAPDSPAVLGARQLGK